MFFSDAKDGGARVDLSTPVIVWVVDDKPDIRNLIGRLLDGYGGLRCQREFECPSDMLKALKSSRPPEVILMDIHMGRENGIDAIGPVLREAPDTRVVIMTTFFDALFHNRAMAAGASEFLLKSGSTRDFVEAIRSARASKPKMAVPVTARVAAPAEVAWRAKLLARLAGLLPRRQKGEKSSPTGASTLPA